MPFKTTLEAALAHLKAKGIIKRDSDIMEPLGIKSKGTVSSYASGTHAMSRGFKEKFENYYSIKLADFENSVGGEEESINKKAPPVEDGTIKDKYIALLEAQNQHLQAQITAQWEERVTALEARLNELLNNQLVSEAMSQAYQEYAIEAIWKIQGKKVNGKQILVEIQKKAFEKLATFEEQGLHIEQLS